MEENMLSKWDSLEDKLGVCSYVAFNDKNKWSYRIYSILNHGIFEQVSGYETKNEARIALINKLTELAK